MTLQDKKTYEKVCNEQIWCQLCGSPNIEIHHIFEGRNRKNSTKYGMLVCLCKKHHKWVHSTNYKGFKEKAQKEFEKTHSREEFIKIFGRNYL